MQQHVEALLWREAANGAKDNPVALQSSFTFRLGGRATAPEFVGVNGVLNQQTAVGKDAAFQAALMQVGGDAEDALVARQAPAIEGVVEGRAAGVVNPAVDGGDEVHRP